MSDIRFPVGETREEFEAAVDNLLEAKLGPAVERLFKQVRDGQTRPAQTSPSSNHILACKRVAVAKCPARLPAKYIEALEHNQLIASCCRHPENHEVEAWWSCEGERQRGAPDIYKFFCTCGRTHVRFCVGGGDVRPFWGMR